MAGPRFVTVQDAGNRGPLSRSKLYQLAALHPGLFLKAHARTIVDLDRLDAILAAMPAAIIKHTPRKRKTAA
jgi:hypothetical protein